MAGAWHVLVGQKSVGPASSAEVLRAHFLGRYGPDTLVRPDGADDWLKLSDVFPLAELQPPPIPNDGAKVSGAGAMRKSHWTSEEPYAWRRYFARQFDTLIHAYVMFVFLGAVLAGSDAAYLAMVQFENPLVLNILGVAMAVVPSVILLGLTGRTLGKLIFGVRVLSANGKPPGVFRALKRELQVLLQGLALGIPIITLFTFIGGYNKLQSQGHTDWDASNELTTWYRAPTILHWILMLMGVALWIFILALVYEAGRNA
jgi:uncharacterized RDD family membrane protein YckC